MCHCSNTPTTLDTQHSRPEAWNPLPPVFTGNKTGWTESHELWRLVRVLRMCMIPPGGIVRRMNWPPFTTMAFMHIHTYKPLAPRVNAFGVKILLMEQSLIFRAGL